MSELKASNVVWKRLRNVLITAIGFAAVGGGVVYAYFGGRILLDADGMITRNRISVSAPFDSRIKQLYVRPGDFVRAGQKIAMVESPSIARTLADLTVEKARMMARIAQLEARRTVVAALLPMAKANTEQGQSFLGNLMAARAKGLTVDKSIQELSSLQISAAERSLSLESETAAVETELQGTQAALAEISKTCASIKETYDDGILTAPVDGYIGSTVAAVGEVLSANSATVAQIYSGTTFALAYLPESYLFDVEEGQIVGVKVRAGTIPAIIEKVLPVTEALPPEFQIPNRVRERGQLVRISLEGKGSVRHRPEGPRDLVPAFRLQGQPDRVGQSGRSEGHRAGCQDHRRGSADHRLDRQDRRHDRHGLDTARAEHPNRRSSRRSKLACAQRRLGNET